MRHPDVFIGLGSNLQDPIQQVQTAVHELYGLDQVQVRAVSGLYRSPPMGGLDQPNYINAVAWVETNLEPQALLQELQNLENQHGREPSKECWASRTLDLDLLLWGREVLDSPSLTLPHPGLHERAFVLAPLRELNAQLQVPGHGSVEQMLRQCTYHQAEWIASCCRLPEQTRFITVEGPIGVGKTTLCNRLAADFDAQLMLEGFQDNPFLRQFYESPQHVGLAVQLHFLTCRVQQLCQLGQQDLFQQRTITDFLIEKDEMFAQMVLTGDEYDLWLNLYTHLTPSLPKPDLVIYLQAPVPVLMERIAARGRSYEQNITPEYLQRLSKLMTEFFQSYAGTLLTVDTTHCDLAGDSRDYQRLLMTLHEMAIPGQYYLDPSQPVEALMPLSSLMEVESGGMPSG